MATNHLITERRGDEYRLIFHVVDDDGSNQFAYDVRRVSLGIVLPDSDTGSREYGYICAIGERVFYPRGKESRVSPETMFVIIDEYEGPEVGTLLTESVRMKDKYLCENIFCRKEDTQTVKDAEGLSFYRNDRIAREYEYVFPSFVDVMTVAHVTSMDMPGDKRLGHITQLSALLSTYAKDPDTGQPVLDGDGKATPRLIVFEELNTDKASGGLQRPGEESEISTAVWLASAGMDRFRPRFKQSPYHTVEHKKNKHTGY